MGTDIHIRAEKLTELGWEPIKKELPRYRNYQAFAVLANVRNGFGFAGMKTGDAVLPIAEPRGLPTDTSIKENEDYDSPDYFWFGDHSFSWIMLSELLAYNLEQEVKIRGMCDAEAADRLAKTGKMPESWCGWSSDENMVEFEHYIKLRDNAPLLVSLIESLAGEGDPSQIRLVFGFDS